MINNLKKHRCTKCEEMKRCKLGSNPQTQGIPWEPPHSENDKDKEFIDRILVGGDITHTDLGLDSPPKGCLYEPMNVEEISSPSKIATFYDELRKIVFEGAGIPYPLLYPHLQHDAPETTDVSVNSEEGELFEGPKYSRTPTGHSQLDSLHRVLRQLRKDYPSKITQAEFTKISLNIQIAEDTIIREELLQKKIIMNMILNALE